MDKKEVVKKVKPVILKTCMHSGTGSIFEIRLPISIKVELKIEDESK